MRIEQDFSNEMKRFFIEMGLEEEIDKLTDMFADNFMIKGERTEELKEALHMAPDSLLDIIWKKITGEEPDKELSRQKKEEGLYEDIPGYFESRFELLDAGKISLLIRVMNDEPVDMMESKQVMEEFIPFGWVFAFGEGQTYSLVIMKEVQDIIMTLEKPEVKDRISLLNGIRFVVNTCLELYGVCTLEQIMSVLLGEDVEETVDEEEEGECENIEETVQEFLPYLEEQRVLWLDGKYIVSPYLKTEKEYKELLRRQKKNYYVPDIEMIKVFGSGKILVKNEEYQTVFKLLNREIKDQDRTEVILENLSKGVAREDWEIPKIMNCLCDWNVEFTSDKAADKLIESLSKWIYGIRRWSECGHSRKELYKDNTDLKYIASGNKIEAEKKAVKKVYPNDPCPCGSGKKYKKCCGKSNG